MRGSLGNWSRISLLLHIHLSSPAFEFPCRLINWLGKQPINWLPLELWWCDHFNDLLNAYWKQ